jgi:hypothetical protein
VNSNKMIVGSVAALVVVASLLLAAGPAAADPPTDSHNGGALTIHCDLLGPLNVQATTYGEWVHAAEPRLVTDSNLVLVAYAFHYVFTPAVGAPTVVDGSKPPPKNGRLDRCTFSISDPTGPNGVPGVFTATYWVSYTPN